MYHTVAMRFPDLEFILRYHDAEAAKTAYEDVCAAWYDGCTFLEIEDIQAKWTLKLERCSAVRLIDDTVGIGANEGYNQWFKKRLEELRDEKPIGFSLPSRSQEAPKEPIPELDTPMTIPASNGSKTTSLDAAELTIAPLSHLAGSNRLREDF